MTASARIACLAALAAALAWPLPAQTPVQTITRSLSLPPGARLVTGLVYFAVENLDDGSVGQRGTAGSSGIAFEQLVLAPDTRYRVWLLEAEAFRIARVEFQTPGPGLSLSLPGFSFVTASSHDTDGDGLHDLGEFVLGTLPLDVDSDGDGILDGAEARQGSDSLEGSPARTGVIGTAATPGNAVDVDAFNDVVAVADSVGGLLVFNVFNGMDPILIAQVATGAPPGAVSIAGDLVALALGAGGVAVANIADPPNAVFTARIALGSPAVSIATDGQFGFAGLANGTVVAVEMGGGLEVDRLDVAAGQIDDLSLSGGVLFAATEGTVFALAFEEGRLTLLGSVSSPGGRNNDNGRMRLFVGGGIAYHVHRRGYNTIDVSDPASLSLIQAGNTSQFGWKRIVVNGSGLGLAAVSPNQAFDGPHNVSLYDTSDPAETNAFLTEFETPGVARSVSIYNGIGYVADNAAGLHVINYLAFDSAGQPPSVSIAAPLDGASVEAGSSLLVQASVEDDVQVRNVEFYVDGILVKTDGNFPFEVVVPAGLSGAATTILRARASDTGGNAAFSDPVTITLTPDVTAPRVVGVRPGPGAIAGGVLGLTAFFSEPVEPDTVDLDSLSLFGAGPDGRLGGSDDEQIESGRFVQSNAGAIVSYTLPEALDRGAYRIRVDTSIADNSGNSLAAPFQSVFLALDEEDSDRDGAPDAVEPVLGLDPFNPDSNGNGLPDGEEDFDGDGAPNALEVFLGLDPANPDTDGDGVPDGEEDADADGLPDFRETLLGTDPESSDTDGDGFDDNLEFLSNSDPLFDGSVPKRFVASQPTLWSNLRANGQILPEEAVFSQPLIFNNLAGEPFDETDALSQPLIYDNN